MKLEASLHQIMTPKFIALLRQFNVTTLTQLLSLQPEKLGSILSLPFSTITQLRVELFKEHSSFPVVGLELYQAGLEEEVQVHTGSQALDQVVGGLQGGLVYEVFGCAGSGKTQLCLTAAATCVHGGGGVIYIDTKADFCPVRFGTILAERQQGQVDMLAIDRLKVARVTTHIALVQAVTKIMEDMVDIKMIVVDNISAPLMGLVGNSSIQQAFTTGNKVGHLLHRVADSLGAVVIVASNLKGGGIENLPALGGIWGGLADVRLFLEQVTDEERMVKVVRGMGILGRQCRVKIGRMGVNG